MPAFVQKNLAPPLAQTTVVQISSHRMMLMHSRSAQRLPFRQRLFPVIRVQGQRIASIVRDPAWVGSWGPTVFRRSLASLGPPATVRAASGGFYSGGGSSVTPKWRI